MDKPKVNRGKKLTAKALTAAEVYLFAEQLADFSQAIKVISADLQKPENRGTLIPRAPFNAAFEQLEGVTRKLQEKIQETPRLIGINAAVKDLLKD